MNWVSNPGLSEELISFLLYLGAILGTGIPRVELVGKELSARSSGWSLQKTPMVSGSITQQWGRPCRKLKFSECLLPPLDKELDFTGQDKDLIS